MTRETIIIDGKGIAQKVLDEVSHEVQILLSDKRRAPGLSTVLVGPDPASALYVKNKRKKAKLVGIESFHYELPENTSEEHLLGLIDQLNQNDHVDGILVQLPLPSHIRKSKIVEAIHPLKDVDGLHSENAGRLFRGRPRLVPCTPLGCMRLLSEYGIEVGGKIAVVVGRSNIVGRPMGACLLNANASVIICHRLSNDIRDLTRMADILVVATGKPGLITGDHIKDGAAILDVGITRLPEGGIVGDLDLSSVLGKASFISPVPGGVGPMTIAMLLRNTLTAYQLRELKGQRK